MPKVEEMSATHPSGTADSEPMPMSIAHAL
jgi:hypothetical protein